MGGLLFKTPLLLSFWKTICNPFWWCQTCRDSSSDPNSAYFLSSLSSHLCVLIVSEAGCLKIITLARQDCLTRGGLQAAYCLSPSYYVFMRGALIATTGRWGLNQSEARNWGVDQSEGERVSPICVWPIGDNCSLTNWNWHEQRQETISASWALINTASCPRQWLGKYKLVNCQGERCVKHLIPGHT